MIINTENSIDIGILHHQKAQFMQFEMWRKMSQILIRKKNHNFLIVSRTYKHVVSLDSELKDLSF